MFNGRLWNRCNVWMLWMVVVMIFFGWDGKKFLLGIMKKEGVVGLGWRLFIICFGILGFVGG